MNIDYKNKNNNNNSNKYPSTLKFQLGKDATTTFFHYFFSKFYLVQ